MEDTLNTLSQTVEQIQESQNHLNTEKKWCLGLIQEEIEQQERDWKVELTQLNQVVHMLEKSINDSAVDQSDIAKKIEKLEGTQIDLVHLCEEVRISTDELAKSAAIWYPKYEAAACIVSELSFKLEQTDEKIRGIYCDENLLQHMAQLAESKVSGLKDMVSSSVLAQCRPQLQNILEQVENEKLAHRQVNLHTCGIYTCNCSVFHYPFSNL
jgi:chromosome segregation ATPase